MSEQNRNIGSGAPGKLRKAIHEYSTNPHAISERQRHRNLPLDIRKAFRAKENVRVKVFYHIKKLKKTQLYQNANDNDRESMEEEVKREILGVIKSTSLEIGSDTESQSEMSEQEDDSDVFDFDAISDDDGDVISDRLTERGYVTHESGRGNKSKEKEEESDIEGGRVEEEEASGDDESEGGSDKEIDDAFDEEEVQRLESELGIEISHEWKERVDHGIWGKPNEAIAWIHSLPRWKAYWTKAYYRLEATMHALKGGSRYPPIEWIKCIGGLSYPKKLPHQLFDHGQRAIWRNLSLWAPEKLNQLMGKAPSEPLTLPGPNGWWGYLWRVHKYSAKRHGFWQPKQTLMQRSKDAWKLLFFPEGEEAREEYTALLYTFSRHDVGKPNDCFYL